MDALKKTLAMGASSILAVTGMGGVNQLWLGSTAASYFARDIVSITLEERETPPPSPHSDEARAAYQNLPNVGVLLGWEVR